MPSLVVASPNLTIDRTARIAALIAGGVLRTRTVDVSPGGKGVNVARAAAAFGVPAVVVGFTAGHTGRAVAGMLAEEDVELRSVEVAGETRSTAVLTDGDGATTVINEPGPAIEEADWAALEEAVAQRLDAASWLVCSGSCPPGAPANGYARLADLAGDRGVPTLVDSSRGHLAAAVDAGVAMVSPNLAEAEAVLDGVAGEPVEPGDRARERAESAATRLAERTSTTAVVSAGAAGLAAASDGRLYWACAPSVTVVNPIGAGDVLAGALAMGWTSGRDFRDVLAHAVAAAAASVEDPRAGRLDRARADDLLDEVAVWEVRP